MHPRGSMKNYKRKQKDQHSHPQRNLVPQPDNQPRCMMTYQKKTLYAKDVDELHASGFGSNSKISSSSSDDNDGFDRNEYHIL